MDLHDLAGHIKSSVTESNKREVRGETRTKKRVTGVGHFLLASGEVPSTKV